MAPSTVAEICHEANRVLCESQGDHSQSSWADAPEWQKKSAVNGVRFHLDNPDAKPEDSHNNWLKEKEADGWKYGPEKDPEKKIHPCFVPYADLPTSQQAKDHLFMGIINSLRPFIDGDQNQNVEV